MQDCLVVNIVLVTSEFVKCSPKPRIIFSQLKPVGWEDYPK